MRAKIISRNDWGAEPPRGPMTPLGAVHRQVLHHSVVQDHLKPDSSQKKEAKAVRAIQQGHFEREPEPFSDIAYHYLVAPSGRIYEGRSSRYQGAGVLGENEDTVHVCVIGNYDEDEPSAKALRSAAAALSKLPGRSRPLFGHGDIGSSDCPGANLSKHLEDIAGMRG